MDGVKSTFSHDKEMFISWRMPNYISSSASTTTTSTTTTSSSAAGLDALWETAYPLKIYNSLTRTKTTFVPMTGKRVTWYMCGPTVYDSSHMGHARTYVAFDVLRRIMTHVFNYDVILTMNITDIDDKIINKSREAEISFEELARGQEKSFLADMESLGVLPPDVMTRVSEYVPEIVTFISGIIKNGFAYESGGSVYFSTTAYKASGHHKYGKLFPEAVGNSKLLEEGEGALSTSAGLRDKRDANDFALWKASKPGEPFWSSPWGNGRPGWHIECSAMCEGTLGSFNKGSIDIHSGGIDLKFPHHENEVAQSEAYHDCSQWVNYFIHSGHLHIEGLKMSKSLKNFITIKDAVEHYGARQLRLLFLLQRYNAPMNYSATQMESAANEEKIYIEFFDNIKAQLRTLPQTSNQHWAARDLKFAELIAETKQNVRAALADDFNTPEALSLLSSLVRNTNKYSSGVDFLNCGLGKPVPLLLQGSASYITDMFRVFGLVDATPTIGFSDSSEGGNKSESREVILTPYLDALSSFREQVRTLARSGDSKGLLVLCDTLRDDVLLPLGVKLEDAAPGVEGESGARWKLRSPDEIKRESETKKAAAEAKAKAKAEAAAEVARKAAEKEAKASTDPKSMFKIGEEFVGKFSAYDEDGVPTHDAAGVELAKNDKKRLRKDWEQQKKLNDWLLEKRAKEVKDM
jgi:cysteinyl-tRNA synthetase